ncbi:alpha/beta fold hydrolase [Candidatus Lokiarchaeum ossiferum]|uniref:alpha/beta fold hydrolase n=1 Tax=Candidatus Lokiarchaeum ossiferum TaxID=2951803 RepID=UPI00352D960C
MEKQTTPIYRKNIIFIHGYESSGQGYKGTYLKTIFPHILTPNFTGELEERMEQLIPILTPHDDWILIGSSFGGLMSVKYASEFPEKVDQLILFAPALVPPYMPQNMDIPSLSVPTTIYHGQQDQVVSIDIVRQKSISIFPHLTFNVVEDDHFLRPTVKQVPWSTLVTEKS